MGKDVYKVTFHFKDCDDVLTFKTSEWSEVVLRERVEKMGKEIVKIERQFENYKSY